MSTKIANLEKKHPRANQFWEHPNSKKNKLKVQVRHTWVLLEGGGTDFFYKTKYQSQWQMALTSTNVRNGWMNRSIDREEGHVWEAEGAGQITKAPALSLSSSARALKRPSARALERSSARALERCFSVCNCMWRTYINWNSPLNPDNNSLLVRSTWKGTPWKSCW